MFSADILDNEGNLIRTLSRGSFDVGQITREINGSGSAEIRIPTFLGIGASRVENPVLSELSVKSNGWRKINIYYEKTPFNRSLLFSGFIYYVANTTIQVVYQCAGIEPYLQRKQIDQSIIYPGPTDTAFSILNSEWEKINFRYPTGINISSTDTTLATVTIERGEKFGQVINRIAELGFEYKYEYPNIFIEKVIGNVVPKPLAYHYASTISSNILPPDRVDEDGGLLGNACYGKAGINDNFYSNVPPTQEEITVFRNFVDGDVVQKTEEYVNTYSAGEQEYTVILENNKWELDEISVGDFVNMNIVRGASAMDIIGATRVIRQEIIADGGDIINRVSVSNAPFQEDVTSDMLSRIKALEDLA